MAEEGSRLMEELELEKQKLEKDIELLQKSKVHALYIYTHRMFDVMWVVYFYSRIVKARHSIQAQALQ